MINDNKLNLIIKAQRNDKNALEALIRQEQNNIYSTLFYLKKDDNDILDIMQDILIKMSKKISNLKNPSNFKVWLNQIIINSYYDYLRKHKNKTKFETNIDDTHSLMIDYKFNPQEKILNSELDNIIKKSIQNLPNQYKIPITLREIQGLSYSDISALTNSNLGTIKSRIARARSIIKNDLKRYLNNG